MDVHPTKNVSIGIDPYPYMVIIMVNMWLIYMVTLWNFYFQRNFAKKKTPP
jgi:hypothetical protein